MSIGKIRSYFQKKDGTTAVEFALLFTPFFLLMMGVIELSLFYASGVAVEGAALSASRLVRTGQAQTSGDAQNAFENAMCSQVGVMVNCADITYEAIKMGNSFSGAAATAVTLDDDGNMVSSGFDAGNPEDVIMVRLAYRHEFLLPLLGQFLGDGTGTNSSQHVSTVVLRTEPYSF